MLNTHRLAALQGYLRCLNGYILINQTRPTGAGAVGTGLPRLSNMWDFQGCKLSEFCRFLTVTDTRISNVKNTCVFCKGHLAEESAPLAPSSAEGLAFWEQIRASPESKAAGVQLQAYRIPTPQKHSREHTILIMWAWENAHGGGAEKVTLT